MVVAAAIPAVARSSSSSIGGDHNNGCFPVMQILWDGAEITNEVEITQIMRRLMISSLPLRSSPLRTLTRRIAGRRTVVRRFLSKGDNTEAKSMWLASVGILLILASVLVITLVVLGVISA